MATAGTNRHRALESPRTSACARETRVYWCAVSSMRIGIDARLRAYRGGGIASHVNCLLEGLARLDPPEEIVVLAHRRDRAPTPAFSRRRLFTPPHHRFEGLALPLELCPARLDLLHSPDFIVPAMWRGASVATIHDLSFLRWGNLLTPESRRYYDQVHRSISAAERVIAVSEYTRREIENLTAVDPSRIRVVHNAVHPRFSAPADTGADDARLRSLAVERPFILFVSTIEPRKNVMTLLRAMALVAESGHDVRLVLAGADGWQSGEVYAAAAKLAVSQPPLFLGFVGEEELASLYRNAALLAHPALDEGFGLTPLEAMATGTPAVVSDAGSLPEVVGEAALRVPPLDPRGWADAIVQLLDSSALAAEMSRAGRRRARCFTVEKMAAATIAVYREALAYGGRTRAGRGR